MRNTYLRANADTWIDQARPGRQHGGSSRLKMSAASDKKYALVHISIPNLKGATVQAAHLKVRLAGSAWVSGNSLKADLLLTRFHEEDDWHSYNADLPSLPGVDQAVTTLSGSPAEGDVVSLDVTDMLADAAAGAEPWHGFLLHTTAGSTRALYASEASNVRFRPHLVIAYSQRPAFPVELAPAIGCSLTKPKFQWVRVDQTAFQLQIADDGDFDSPDFDTADEPEANADGFIETEDQQYDSSTGSWGGLASGSSTNWRVRIVNEVGAVSSWSEVATFTRHSYRTLTIDTPASDGDLVDATTPLIQWTFAGTQSGYRILVDAHVSAEDYRDLKDIDFGGIGSIDPVTGDYDSGRISTDDSEFELPEHVVRRRIHDYTVQLRVWDNFDRDAPGEKAYTFEERTFQYDGTASTAPVETITADTAEGPWLKLVWTRSSMPDKFAVFKDGKHISTHEAADVLVSGTTYRTRVFDLQPTVMHTWEVKARDESTGDSNGNPTVDAAFTPQGIFVVLASDPQNPYVKLEGQSNISTTVVEDGATFLPLGRRAPIRVTDKIRGFSGTVSGIVYGRGMLDDLGDIKAAVPEDEIRLIYGMFSYPVVLGEVTVNEWPVGQTDDGPAADVSLEFWQVGPPWPV